MIIGVERLPMKSLINLWRVFNMQKTIEIIKHINDLYTDNEFTYEMAETWCIRNKERYTAWKEAFESYDTVDVLKAIDEYWRYTSNKTKPKVSQLLAMLNTSKAEKRVQLEESGVKYICIEEKLFHQDKELGRNTNCWFPHYKRAVEYILDRLLPSTIGMQEYSRLNDEDLSLVRGRKYKLALENGLFDKFDEILQQVARVEI